ncbi:MAG: hypothetical protein LBP28_06335, partial [Coriobacteriales bacterium]|nr:hypothetical protein [Coriobacteriales bacterium]
MRAVRERVMQRGEATQRVASRVAPDDTEGRFFDDTEGRFFCDDTEGRFFCVPGDDVVGNECLPPGTQKNRP